MSKCYNRKDAKYSRNLHSCWCIAGNCKHFDAKLCALDYDDSISDAESSIRKLINDLLSDVITKRNVAWIAEGSLAVIE